MVLLLLLPMLLIANDVNFVGVHCSNVYNADASKAETTSVNAYGFS